jgi:Secretion system C-terminal sorting domain
MFFSTKRLVYFAALAGLTCGGGLTATGQSISPSTGTCISASATNTSFTFTPPTGYTFYKWSFRGDLALDVIAGNTVKSNPVKVKSVNAGTGTAPGYGKGRVVATYYKPAGGGCTGADTAFRTFDSDVFKSFNAPDPIIGPTCVAGATKYAYSVVPRLSDTPQLSAGIGIDTYAWTITPASAGTIGYISGDKSAITVQTASPAVAFVLRVQVGTCNPYIAPPGTTPTQEIAVNPIQTAASILTVPTCRPTNASGSTSLTVNTITGTNYTITLPIGWGFAAPAPTGLTVGANTGTLTGTGSGIAVPFTTDANAGDVIVQTTGGCSGGQTIVKRVSRQLSAINTIVNPGCLTRNSPVVISLSANPPLNSYFYWTVPAGWPVDLTYNNATYISGTTYRTSAAAIKITPKGNGGTITANSGSDVTECVSSPAVSLLLRVNGGNGCGPFTLYRVGSRAFGVKIGSVTYNACLPDASLDGAGVLYTWTALTTLNGVQSRTSDYNEMSTAFSSAVSTGTNVTLHIQNTAQCYDTTMVIAAPVSRPAPNPGGGTAVGDQPSARRAAPGLVHGIGSFPNPAGDRLEVEVETTAGTTVQVTLLDNLGRTVARQNLTGATGSLNTSQLPSGTYQLRATYPDGKTLGHAVLIQH